MALNNKMINYILTFLIIGLSGFPFFTTGYEPMIYVSILIIGIYVLNFKYIYFIKKDLYVIMGFVGLSILQLAYLSQYDFMSFMGLFLPIVVALLYIKIIGNNFFHLYVKIMVYLCSISLVLYVLLLLFPEIQNYLVQNIAPFFSRKNSIRGYSYSTNILIYVFKGELYNSFLSFDYNNPGPFWESGAFGIYTNLALFINMFILGSKFYSKYNIIFICTILTTFSTAAYIVLFYVIIGFVYMSGNKSFVKYLIVVMLLYLSYITYFDIPFLAEKVNSRAVSYAYAIEQNEKQERIGTFYKDIHYLMNNPIIGYGNDPVNKIENFKQWEVLYTHKNNGVSNILLILGLPVALFFFMSFKNLKYFTAMKINRIGFNVYLVLFVVLLGFSQIILTKMVFLCLFWISILWRYYENIGNNAKL